MKPLKPNPKHGERNDPGTKPGSSASWTAFGVMLPLTSPALSPTSINIFQPEKKVIC